MAVLVQITKLSRFKTQNGPNSIIKQTWFQNLYQNEPLYKVEVILSHYEVGAEHCAFGGRAYPTVEYDPGVIIRES